MGSANDKVGVVVNYYTSFSSPETNEIVAATTSLSLRFLKMSPRVGTVCLMDGSARPDGLMRSACDETGAVYRHEGRKLSYVESYNIGWRSLAEAHIALMANDILPYPPASLDLLFEWVKKPDVGCTFPYLSSDRLGGDEVQRLGFARRGTVTCEPTSMTLNLNLFKRTVLERMGGLDENYRYGYAEPILISKTRSLGLRVVMVGNARAFHYDRLTKKMGESSLDRSVADADTARWYREYPQYASRRGLGHIDLSRRPFATTFMARALWRCSTSLPSTRIRRRVMQLVMWLEPLITRYPAKHGLERVTDNDQPETTEDGRK